MVTYSKLWLRIRVFIIVCSTWFFVLCVLHILSLFGQPTSIRAADGAASATIWVLDPTYGQNGLVQVQPSPQTVRVSNYQAFVLADEQLVISLEAIERDGRGFYNKPMVFALSSTGTISATVALDEIGRYFAGVQSDGRLLLYRDDVLRRYSFDLVPDSSFVTMIPNRYLSRNSCCFAVQQDDSMLVATKLADAQRVVRLLPDGSTDQTFAQTVGPFSQINNLIAHPRGGFVVQDTAATASNCSARLYQQDGTFTALLYETFVWEIDNFCNVSTANFVPYPDGGFVWTRPDLSVRRSQADGARDATFGTEGVARLPLPTSSLSGLFALATTVTSDGKIFVVGGLDSPYSQRFVVGRFTSTGQPDRTFSRDGVVYVTLPLDSLRLVHVQPDGKIVLVGSASGKIVVARLHEVPIVETIYLPKITLK